MTYWLFVCNPYDIKRHINVLILALNQVWIKLGASSSLMASAELDRFLQLQNRLQPATAVVSCFLWCGQSSAAWRKARGQRKRSVYHLTFLLLITTKLFEKKAPEKNLCFWRKCCLNAADYKVYRLCTWKRVVCCLAFSTSTIL